MRHKRPYKKALTLNKEKKKFLGVCAGIADYLEVEPWSVRLVFMVSILFGGWFLIPIYFIAWFCLDDRSGESFNNITDSQPFRHFRTVDYRKKLYRNTEAGKFLGVCAGVADYLEVNVFAVRLGFLVLVFFTAALPLFLYFGAYFILEEKPHTRIGRSERRQRRSERKKKMEDAIDAGVAMGMEAGMSVARNMAGKVSGKTEPQSSTGQTNSEGDFEDFEDAEEGTFNSRVYSKRKEFKYCARKFATLQNRLAKMEAYVTSNQFRLHREFKNI